MKKVLTLILLTLSIGARAENGLKSISENLTFPTDNWFVQTGFDMELTHPYGYSMKNVFPNGRTFGVNVGVGRWFTPQIAPRLKVGWENGIGLLENRQAKWLDLYSGQVGHNMDAGGRITLFG